MKIGGKELTFTYKPIACYESSIGRLAIFSISLGHNEKLLESMGTDLASCDPLQFIKNLLLYICYPVDALGDEQTKPDEIALSSEDIDKLTDEEVNQIAELYVEHEPYLYRKQISKTKTGEDGKSVVSFAYGDIEHPREKDESSVQYLHRLYVIQEDKQKEKMARLMSSIKTAQFSPQTFKSISDTLSMGNSIYKAVEAMQFAGMNDSFAKALESMNQLYPNKSTYASINSGIPQQVKPIEDMQMVSETGNKIIDAAAKARWEPFNYLAEKLETLISSISELLRFTNQSNETQFKIASEIKKAGDHASQQSERNINLTYCVIFITIMGLFLAFWNSCQNSRGADNLLQSAEGIRADLKNVVECLDNFPDNRLKADPDELEQQRLNENNRLNIIMAEQSKNIERLKQQQAADKQTIERLHARISELEKGIRKE